MTESFYGLRLLLLAFIVAANAFFASAEVALLTVSEPLLRANGREGQGRRAAALSLLGHPERLLSVTQVGVTLASLGLGWAGEDTVYRILLAWLAPAGGGAGWLHAVSFFLAFWPFRIRTW